MQGVELEANLAYIVRLLKKRERERKTLFPKPISGEAST